MRKVVLPQFRFACFEKGASFPAGMWLWCVVVLLLALARPASMLQLGPLRLPGGVLALRIGRCADPCLPLAAFCVCPCSVATHQHSLMHRHARHQLTLSCGCAVIAAAARSPRPMCRSSQRRWETPARPRPQSVHGPRQNCRGSWTPTVRVWAGAIV